MPKEIKVTANIRYARVVIMETTKEVLESDFDGDEYVGPCLESENGGLPGVFDGLDRPDHVDSIVDYEEIWEVEKGPRII